MTSRELINVELDRLDERDLEDLYPVIQRAVQEKLSTRKPGIMSRLRQIKIEAPEDFSVNLDLYLNGEKQLPERSDLH
jgi:hypothetical protein